ncbi:MAG TPA: S8 family serine peptidase [Ilumatobacteraceae bacterium]|nr:S8 family serine peptidase [Ilumatobacteraceae bacterium]
MDITDHFDYPGDDIPHAAKLRARGIAVAAGPAGPSLVRANSLLVDTPDDDHLDKLQRFVGERTIGGCRFRLTDDTVGRTATGCAAIEFKPSEYTRGVSRSAADHHGPRWSVQGVIETGRALAAQGFSSRPNHVYMCNAVYAGNPGGYSPNLSGTHFNATSAVPADGPLEFANEIVIRGRRRPAVLILDTGLNTTRDGATAHARHEMLRGDRLILRDPWRSDPTGIVDDEDEADDDPSTAEGAGVVDRAAGHGTFIAGIVRRLCPEAIVHVEGVLSSFGDGDDDTIGQGIQHATGALGRPFDVVVMSLGAYTGDDRPPPLTDTLAANVGPGTVVVASAGNNSSPRPQFPAALPGVVAVGALDSGGRAWFSNFGPWVDACAPGVDVLSTYLFHEEKGGPARTFNGYARWSGTSFAAPKVAAVIAREMYTSLIPDDTARAAWTRLSTWQKLRAPDLGVVFNVV